MPEIEPLTRTGPGKSMLLLIMQTRFLHFVRLGQSLMILHRKDSHASEDEGGGLRRVPRRGQCYHTGSEESRAWFVPRDNFQPIELVVVDLWTSE